jgi:hypothetical protein
MESWGEVKLQKGDIPQTAYNRVKYYVHGPLIIGLNFCAGNGELGRGGAAEGRQRGLQRD